jgi:hypothetical protein
MESSKKRPLSVRAQFISPYRKIYKPRVEEERKKPITINIIASYMRYKKHPLTGDLKQNLKRFMKSLNGKDNVSSLLKNMKNFMERKKMNTRNYHLVKKNDNKINKPISNSMNNSVINMYKNQKPSSIIYNKRYQNLMRNVSFNGSCSQKSFKNISNNMLDTIFNYSPYIPFEENVKIIDKIPDKYKLFFQSMNNQSKDYNYSKDSEQSSIPRLKNDKKVDLIGKKVSFENKMLNKLSDQKVFNYLYSDRDNNLYKQKYLEFNMSNENTIESRSKDSDKFYSNFKNLKLKLQKRDDANNKIKNDIKRQQSMTKHSIQVGIVKLNGYKIKLRQYRNKNLQSKVF